MLWESFCKQGGSAAPHGSLSSPRVNIFHHVWWCSNYMLASLFRYICTICARVFCRRALLRRHHAVHSGFKEFTCSLCDYATSHKSNLERHMKIHESGEKYSSASPSSTSQSAQNDRSSPEVDFFHSGENSSKSYCIPAPPSRDHNPILASLLSQPAHDGEVMQWIYHSPYDSYSSHPQVVVNVVGDGGTPDRRWSYESISQDNSIHGRSQDATCGITRCESSSSPPPTTLPLRHAIDVILGVREDAPKPMKQQRSSLAFRYCGQEMPVVTSCVVTTASNHWSIGHLSSSTPSQHNVFSNTIDASQNSHESNSDLDSASDHVGYKRPWQMAGLYHLSETSIAESEDEDVTYVPKKLRMSKRYQTSLWIGFIFCFSVLVSFSPSVLS